AFHHSSIEVVWKRNDGSPLSKNFPLRRLIQGARPIEDIFTMLLLPFPMHVHTKDFNALEPPRDHEVLDNCEGYGFFQYVQRRAPRVTDMIDIVQQAVDEENSVDVVVLPESAIDDDGLLELIGELQRIASHGHPISLLIAGVSEKAQNSRFERNNTVC